MKLNNEYLLSLLPISLYATIMYSSEEEVDAIDYTSLTSEERTQLLTYTYIGHLDFMTVRHLVKDATIFKLLELEPLELFKVVNSIDPKDVPNLEYSKLDQEHLILLLTNTIIGQQMYASRYVR